MGAGIGYVTAQAGIPVVLLDRDAESADKGWRTPPTCMMGDQEGPLHAGEEGQVARAITTTADYKDLEGCDLVIEAVFEDSGVKESRDRRGRGRSQVLSDLRLQHLDLPITSLAKNSSRPKNFIGIHFFSPVEKMMLVEIIVGKKTGEKAIATAIDYVRAIKKTPIVVNDTRGFYVNRCVLRYMSRILQDADRRRSGGDDRECSKVWPACRSDRWR
jgi:3-hydroxyacyl-CoA dehydrogenase/enoyl-CoA hydratase/3-hydroxybutyryl-CoA epimerase